MVGTAVTVEAIDAQAVAPTALAWPERIRDRGGLKNVLTGLGVSTVISGKKK